MRAATRRPPRCSSTTTREPRRVGGLATCSSARTPARHRWRSPLESGRWGADLKREIADTFGRFITLGAFMEQLPYEKNHRRSVTHGKGSPRQPRRAHPLRPDGWQIREARLRGDEEDHPQVSSASSARYDVRVEVPPLVSGHYMGTHRMGDDPAQSVTDSHLECHDVPGLYLASYGAFPTGGISNPVSRPASRCRSAWRRRSLPSSDKANPPNRTNQTGGPPMPETDSRIQGGTPRPHHTDSRPWPIFGNEEREGLDARARERHLGLQRPGRGGVFARKFAEFQGREARLRTAPATAR